MDLRQWQENFLLQARPDNDNAAMHIYANSILGTKIASLATTYPAIVNLIGQQSFECIAGAYFSYFTESPVDIGLLGIAFPEYLDQHDIISYLPYIADLARFEWQWHNVFESKAGSHELSEKLDDAVIAEYDYPVDQIWECCQKTYSGDFDVDVSPQKITILMRRIGLSILIQRIEI